MTYVVLCTVKFVVLATAVVESLHVVLAIVIVTDFSFLNGLNAFEPAPTKDPLLFCT